MSPTVPIYTNADADLSVLDGRTVSVIGYGNQGEAQALNLRDIGIEVLVGNRDDDYRPKALAAGFEVTTIPDAAARGDVVLLLIPDEEQPAVFQDQIAPSLADASTLVIASGYNWHFDLLQVDPSSNVVMVAPRMIGAAVRSRFVSGDGFPCFVSTEQDATGSAHATALAIARGIGATIAGAIASSAREEAALDLFTEQAIWPAIIDVLRTAYTTLHDAGFSDAAIVYEMYLSGEPAEVFAHAATEGLLGQLTLHSQTSQYGQLRGLAALAGEHPVHADRFRRVLHDDILSGSFAREWRDSAATGATEELRRSAAGHALSIAEDSVRRRTGANRDTNSPRPAD